MELPPTSFQARPILAILSSYEWVTEGDRMSTSTDLAMYYRQQLEIDLTEASIGQLPPMDEPPLAKATLKARNVGAVQWHPKILDRSWRARDRMIRPWLPSSSTRRRISDFLKHRTSLHDS